MSADAAGGIELAGASTGVHGHRLADDQAIADQLADGLPGVGIGDLSHLIGIEPDLPLPAADHGGREALLRTKVDPAEKAQSPPSAFHASFFFPRLSKISWDFNVVWSHQGSIGALFHRGLAACKEKSSKKCTHMLKAAYRPSFGGWNFVVKSTVGRVISVRSLRRGWLIS